ncbi:LysR family transcriptional regulator [Azorhizobium sp. AG788]|uniref:LysR family transcriptional regulator n=1 Tax=Azorhizobium sp. AG788 TaxID=2183897 RepID=UPI0031389AF8
MIELKRLRQIIVVSETGSFAQAAKLLNLSQPALSRSVQELERQLGAPLFDRGNRQVRLTEIGALVVHDGQDILRRATALERAIQDKRGAQAGTIVFGSGLYSNMKLMPAAVSAFAADHPRVQLNFISGGWRDCRDLLDRGVMDLFIGEQIEPDDDHRFSQRALKQRQGAIVVRKDHPLCGLEACTVDAVARYPFAGARLPERIHGRFPPHSNLGTMDPRRPLLVPHFEAYSWDAVAAIVRETDAFAFGSRDMVALEAASLVCLDLDLPWLTYEGGVVWCTGRALSPLAATFRDLVVALDEQGRS